MGSRKELIDEAEQLCVQVVNLSERFRYKEAIPLAKRALAIAENALGAEHLNTALSLSNLGELA